MASFYLVTHNSEDFALLQHAWRLWSVPIIHAGILVIPQQRWSASQAALEIDRFVQTVPTLANELYFWTSNRGWVRLYMG